MKKILLLAAALLAFAGCKEKEVQPEPQPQADEITVSPTTRTVGGEGGEVSVTVTSTADWTLASKGNAKYDWVTSSKASGKSGDKVVFTVDPNTDAEKTAEFIFSCGEAQATFTLTSTPQEVVIPTIEVTSEKTVKVGYEKGTFQVTLKVSETVVATDLKAESTGNWITFDGAAAGSSAGTAVMNFSYTENEDEKGREATLTISYPNADSQTVTVTQAAAPEPEVPEYEIKLVTENPVEVEYTEGTAPINVSISDGVDATKLTATSDQIWAKLKEARTNGMGKGMMIFEYTANQAAEARTANITVQYEDVDYFKFQLVQAGDPNAGEPPVGGNYVADMRNHCASPELTTYNSGGKTLISEIHWNAPDVFKLGKTATIEVLVRHDETFEQKTGRGQWDGSWVNTIIGLEGIFLVRSGDNVNNYQEWEVVWNNTDGAENKFKSTENLPGGEWAHIAITADASSNTITLYQNGKSVCTGTIPAEAADIDFTRTISGWAQGQSLCLGRSSDNARDFSGEMAEVRIWNRALTSEEINASGHFYSVSADAKGLVAYWKMNEGEGDTFYDSTSNGNDIKGFYLTETSNASGKTGLDKWALGISWVEALPEVPGFTRN